MDFLVTFIQSTIQYVLMIALAVVCVCLGAVVAKNKKKKQK